jgi:hypothetical protein
VRRADNLTTFMCRLSWNLGALTSWNPQGLSRPIMGLLCFTLLKYRIGWKSVHWDPNCCIRAGGGTDGWLGMTKLIVAFRDFAKAPDSDTICCVIDMAYILCMFVIDKPASCMSDSSSQLWCCCLGSRKPERSSDMSCSQFSFDLSTRDKALFVAQAVRLQKYTYEVTFQNAKQLNRIENPKVLHRYKGVTTCTHRFPTTHRMITLSEKNAGCMSLLLWTVLRVKSYFPFVLVHPCP